MILHHPALLKFSCSDCARWVYDFDTGEKKQRGGRPRPRLADNPLPCTAPRQVWTCPRVSPRHEPDFRLDPRNARTLRLFLRIRAAGWQALPERLRHDAIFLKNFEILSSIYVRFERENEAKRLAVELAPLLLRR